jgi:hypothetical protein
VLTNTTGGKQMKEAKTRNGIVIACLFGTVLISCQFPYDGDNMRLDDAGTNVDPTYYAGIQVVGELAIDGDKPVVGPLSLVQIGVAMLTACFDEQVAGLPSEGANLTELCLTTEFGSDSPDCKGLVCGAHLYNCLGHRLLALSEETGVTQLTTEIFAYSLKLNKEVLEFDLTGWNSDDLTYYRIGPDPRLRPPGTGSKFHYRIPPLTSAQRTWALRAAYAAFQKSGIHGGQAIDKHSPYDCAEYLVGQHQPGDPDPSTLDFFVSTFADTTKMVVETTRQCFSNELDVAATAKSRYRDAEQAQKAKWTDEINSHGSAIRMLVGAQTTECVDPCSMTPQSEGQQIALALLQGTGPAVLLDPNESDEVVAQAALDIIYEDLGSADQPEMEDFLWRKGIRLADIAVARKYLDQERTALDRDITEVGGRLHGLERAAFRHSGGYYLGKTAGFGSFSLDNDPEIYAATGAIQLLDYLRDRSNRLLKRAYAVPGEASMLVLPPDHRRMLAATSIVAGKFAGERRIGFTVRGLMTEAPLDVSVSGVEEKETIHLLTSREAYRCLMHGSVDGAPCSLEGSVLASSNDVSVAGHPPYEKMDSKIAFTGLTLRGTQEVYVVSSRPGRPPMLLINLDVTGEVKQAMVPAWGEVTRDLLPQANDRDETDCGDSETMCSLGVDKDMIPPLENEITENADPYENSWRHYLTLARTAANKADALGEELLRTGLDMDRRAENARQQLEDICGGVLMQSPLPVEACDPQTGECTITGTLDADAYPELYMCLPDTHGGGEVREPYVSLGRKVCIFKWSESGRICSCPDDRADPDRPGGPTCTKQCPVAAPANASSNAACVELYNGLIQQQQWGLPFGDADETPEFILVDKVLNIYQSSGTAGTGLANCDKLDLLRGFTEYDDPYIIEYLWEDLLKTDGWWLNAQTLARVSQAIRYDEDFFHHYTLYLNGQAHWTTKSTSVDNVCPRKYPWLPPSPSNEPIRLGPDQPNYCYNPHPPAVTVPQPWFDWLDDELDGEDAYAWVRKRWGTRLRDMVLKLGVISGKVSNITMGAYMRGEFALTIDPFGEPFTALPIRTEPDDRSKFCFDRDLVGDGYVLPLLCDDPEYHCSNDPGLGLCEHSPGSPHGSWGRRHEGTCGWSLTNSGSSNFFTFWQYGVQDFLTGRLPAGVSDGQQLWDFSHGDQWDCVLPDLAVNIDCPYPLDCALEIDLGSFSEYPNDWFDTSQTTGFRLTRQDFVDTLRFACSLVERGAHTCDDFDPNSLPTIDSPEDLKELESKIICAADAIHSKAELLVLPNMPRTLIEGFQSGGLQSHYPGVQGENLQVMLLLEDDLRRFGTSADNIRDLLFQVALQINQIRLSVDQTKLQARIGQLESMRYIINESIRAATALLSGNWLAAGVQTATSAVNIGFQLEIDELKAEASDIQESLLLSQGMGQIADALKNLRLVLVQISETFSAIQGHLSRKDRLEQKAAQLWATINFEDTDAFGRALPVNTVMRRQHNTARRRYKEAVKRAKKLAYIARRAIEFRLGLDLSTMTGTMTLVPPPKDWADRLCALQGFDYERIREEHMDLNGEDDPLFDPELNPETDSYARQYIGDYVTLLEDFVESYNIDHPFTDENDLAVISLRDDIIRARQNCAIDSYNLLYYSDSVGHDPTVDPQADGQSEHSWKLENCVPEETDTGIHCVQVVVDDTESAYCGADFCFGETYPPEGSPPARATRLREWPRIQQQIFEDQYWTRAIGFQNSGYVSQVARQLAPGDYILSWWAALPTSAASATPYKVDVIDLATDTVVSPGSLIVTPTVSWERSHLKFTISETQDVKVRFHPSAEDRIDLFGDVWIWGAQLERIDPWRCADIPESEGGCYSNAVGPLSYQAVWDDRKIWGEYCPDHDGSAMRAMFDRKCLCTDREAGICEAGSEGADHQQCFWQRTFTLSLDDIEAGRLIPSHAIAIHNFNYRHDEIALNLVGTNIRDCTHSDTQGVCSSNAYIPYTLQHEGTVYVRNHEDTRMEFNMPVARIEHGKALTAEVVVTNPPTSTHNQLLAPYIKTGLRGRPLQGSYVIRIWKTPELQWSAVEDIQLIWKYRYWTKMYDATE